MSPVDDSKPDDAGDIEGVDELYGLDPDAFVPARAALAKQLRSDGRRDAAKAVIALRKPTRAAWAINVAARRAPELRDAVLAAGNRLRDAFSGGLTGGADELRATRDAEREAVDALVDAAVAALEDQGGASPATVDQVRGTLHAAATDDGVREDVRRGRVVRESSGAGFGLEAGLATPAATPKRSPPAPKKAAARTPARRNAAKAADDARSGGADAEAGGADAERARAAAEALRTAEQTAERARREREAQESASADALAARDEARQAAEGAAAALERARRQQESAADRLEDAERDVRHAQTALRRAQDAEGKAGSRLETARRRAGS